MMLVSALFLLVSAFLLLFGTSVATTEPFVTAEDSESFDFLKKFAPPGVTNYRTLTLDGNTLYVGARDNVFGRDTENIEKQRFADVSWPLSDDGSCKSVPQSDNGRKCYNLIQIVQPLNMTHVLICGTNSLAPKNKLLVRENENEPYELMEYTTVRSPLCSFDPTDSVSSMMMPLADSMTILSTPRSELSSRLSLVKTMPKSLLMCNENMEEAHSRSVASFSDLDTAISPSMEKVYFFSDEKVKEPDLRLKYAPTVTQVCPNDIGGQNILPNQWTSLLKLRLLCQTDNKNPFIFDLITHAVKGNDRIMYGTFTTRHEFLRTSAVCSFRLSDIQEAFNTGNFLEEDEKTGVYRAVKSNSPLQPGMCAYRGMLASKPEASTSKEFPSAHLTFMSEHNLVDQVVRPAFPLSGSTANHKSPLLIKNNENFTKIAVDQVTDLGGTVHDVIFVGTHNGYIYKFSPVVKNDQVETVELAKYVVSDQPVISMTLSPEHNMLYVGTDKALHQVSTANCAAYMKSCDFCDPCRMCVLSRDPYCAWDKSKKECVSVQGDKSVLLQDVTNGDAVTQCGDLVWNSSPESTVKVDQKAKQLLGPVVTNSVITCDWYKVKSANKREKVNEKYIKFRVTDDCQLEISDFDAIEDAAKYECEYKAHGTDVNRTVYNVQSSAVVSPKTPLVPTSVSPVTKRPRDNATVLVVAVTAEPRDGQGTTDIPVVSASSGTTIAITVLIACFLIAIVVVLFCIRRRICPAKGPQKYEVSKEAKEFERIDAPDGGSPQGSHDNSTNNNNAHLLGIERVNSNREDSETPLLAPRAGHYREPISATPQHMPLAMQPTHRQNPRNAQSLDDLERSDDIEYIDEADGAAASVRKNSTLEQSSSLREEGGRKRVPPARTKSMPGSSLYVVYAGKKLQCSTLQRNKRGNWTIELADQSGMSDMVDKDEGDVLIEILQPQQDTNNQEDSPKSSPGRDEAAPSETPKTRVRKKDGPRPDVESARKAFFESAKPNGSPTVNYVTSTPNNKALENSERTFGEKTLFPGQKTTFREQSSKASLRSSHNSSEDSDSTVKGSCSTLRPEDTPLLSHPKEQLQMTSVKPKPPQKYRHRHNAPTDQAPRVPSPPVVAPLAGREVSYRGSNESLNKSSGSSDGDEQLHGRDKKSTRKSRNKTPDSPSKESRTSHGSSSGSDYKSARSSVISDHHDAR